MFSDVTLNFQTDLTNMIFTNYSILSSIWKIHLGKCNVKSVKMFQENTRIKEHLQEKIIFLVLSWRFHNFRHILPNPTLKVMASFPVIATEIILA